ncbi:MAG: response regulator transcription factor [Pseudomonadota bacterium]
MAARRVLIADDHAIVRGGLRRILATADDLAVVGEAASGAEALSLLAAGQADLLLLDLAMPGMNGVDLIRRVLQERPGLPILVLSMHNESQIVTSALRAGAAGYVTKDSDPEVLLAAVRKVASGGRYIDPSLVDSVVFHGANRETGPHEQLSARELQVLERIVAGLSLGSIADELRLSPKTVSTHKMRLMHKLGVATNAELLKYALRHGLTSG